MIKPVWDTKFIGFGNLLLIHAGLRRLLLLIHFFPYNN
jgi:hypothetical protein